jgi:hypothetical protein
VGNLLWLFPRSRRPPLGNNFEHAMIRRPRIVSLSGATKVL